MLSILIFLLWIILLRASIFAKDKLSIYLFVIIITWHFFIFFLSSLNPIGFYPVSLYTYSLCILSIYSFSAGFLIFKTKNTYIQKSISMECLHLFIKQNNIYNLALIINCIILFYYSMKYYNLLDSINVSEARLLRYNISFYGNSAWSNLYYNIIITSLFYFNTFLLSGYLFTKKKKSIFILICFYVFMYSYIGSGREPMFFLLLNIIFLYCYLKTVIGKKIFKNNVQSKLFLSLMIAALLGFVVYQSVLRSEQDISSFYSLSIVIENLLNNIFSYIIGPIRCFDYIIHNNYYLDKLGYPWYGFSVCSGLNEYLYVFLRSIGIDTWFSSSKIIGYVQEIQLEVSPQVKYFNYAFTGFLTCYLDYGDFGIFFFSFLFGYIFRFVIIKFYRYNSLPLLAISCYLFYLSIFCFATLELVRMAPWFYLIFLYIAYRRLRFKKVIT